MYGTARYVDGIRCLFRAISLMKLSSSWFTLGAWNCGCLLKQIPHCQFSFVWIFFFFLLKRFVLLHLCHLFIQIIVCLLLKRETCPVQPCSSPGCGGQYRNLDSSGDAKRPFLCGLQRHKSLWWCIVSFSVPVRHCTALVSLLPLLLTLKL